MSNHKTDNDGPGSKPPFILETVNFHHIWMSTLFLTALLVVSILVVTLMSDWKRIRAGFAHFRGQPVYPLSEKLPPYQGKPVLQVDELGDLHEYKKAESEQLDNYGWVDKSAGTAHIPIAEAMKRALAKGYPARKGGT